MSGDFWLGVAATVGFFMTLNVSAAILMLVFCKNEPPGVDDDR
jgi:hypothetical protein